MESDIGRFEKGLFISTGSLAIDTIRIECSNIKLDLIDGDQYVKIFVANGLGLLKKIIYEPNINFFEPCREKIYNAP